MPAAGLVSAAARTKRRSNGVQKINLPPSIRARSLFVNEFDPGSGPLFAEGLDEVAVVVGDPCGDEEAELSSFARSRTFSGKGMAYAAGMAVNAASRWKTYS